MAGTTIGRWRPLRARVRDCLLRPGRADYEIEVECLALLGADTDARATGLPPGPRGRAARTGSPHASSCSIPTMSLAATDLDLLFELTEAYYIEDRSASAGLTGSTWGSAATSTRTEDSAFPSRTGGSARSGGSCPSRRAARSP